MSRAWRLPNTADRLGKVLHFPTRVDQYGQYDLFPPPSKPDRFSASQVIIEYTLLQYRITRIASDLTRRELMELLGQKDALLVAFIEPYELLAAGRRARERANQIARSA